MKHIIINKNRHVIATLFLFISCFLFQTNISLSQQPRDTTRYKLNQNYELQMGMFDIYKTRQADVVMLGNSLTAGANWGELLGRAYVVGRGIPGDVTFGFYARLKHIILLKPKVVFILGGLNDIYGWIPVDEVFSNYVRIINTLKENRITPVIQSTTYSARDYAKDWGGTPEMNAGRNKEVDKLNKMLIDYAKNNNIEYVDIVSKMSTKDNFLRPELTWDGVHLNAEGYKIWAREVEKILRKFNL